MARSDDTTNRTRGPAAKKTARPVKKAAPAKAAPKAKPASPRPKPAPAPAAAAKAKPKKVAAPKPAARPAAEAPVPRARKAAAKPVAAPKATAKTRARTEAPPRPRRAPRPGGTSPEPPRPSSVVLTEEEQIEAAKYLPRELPRLFEEERFIFPESYGQSRIRLLVKDPEWLFAHWDVDPQSLARVRQELGERASALSRLTLRVTDPHNGGESRVLLPEGARSWYVRADGAERSYQAQLGLTLPSGEFRSLAESNTVRTPRSGPSAEGAPRRARYDGATLSATQASPRASERRESVRTEGPGPWRPDPASAGGHPGTVAGASSPAPSDADRSSGGRAGEAPGGASDVYRR